MKGAKAKRKIPHFWLLREKSFLPSALFVVCAFYDKLFFGGGREERAAFSYFSPFVVIYKTSKSFFTFEPRLIFFSPWSCWPKEKKAFSDFASFDLKTRVEKVVSTSTPFTLLPSPLSDHSSHSTNTFEWKEKWVAFFHIFTCCAIERFLSKTYLWKIKFMLLNAIWRGRSNIVIVLLLHLSNSLLLLKMKYNC